MLRSNLLRRSGRVSGGFTLIEMLLSMTITVMVMTGVLTLFQLSGRLARNQTQLSDLQQNLRVSLYDTQRYARMAGRGGLPTFLAPDLPFVGHLIPNGVAVAVGNNVPPGTRMGGAASDPMVLENTDTLTIRGVLFGSVYQSEISVGDFGSNTIRVGRLSSAGVNQDLTALAEAVDRANSGEPEALVVVSPLGTGLYAVVELIGGGVEDEVIDGVNEVKRVTLNFVTAGGTRQTAYYLGIMPEGVFPTRMTSAAYVGVLEEYRYYVREIHANPADPASRLVPRLSRARFYPNSNVRHPSNPTAAEDIADNVWDLQIALGVDVNGNGRIDEGATRSVTDVDEWLFNNKDDELDDPATPGSWVWNGNQLEMMRITALVRTDQRDIKYVSAPIDYIEDREYLEPDLSTDPERQYRRRQVVSEIDFRNL